MDDPPTLLPVETILSRQLSWDDALAIGRLLVQVWPKPNVTVEDRARQVQANGEDYTGPESHAPRSFVIRDSAAGNTAKVIAHAATFPRTIATQSGELTVATLGRVCTDPARRGEQLGARVVRKVFDLVDAGLFPFCLFQTSFKVRPFYQRLGAGEVANRIYSSTLEDPHQNPFWDEVVMRYPAAQQGWPEGDLDLAGPGY